MCSSSRSRTLVARDLPASVEKRLDHLVCSFLQGCEPPGFCTSLPSDLAPSFLGTRPLLKPPELSVQSMGAFASRLCNSKGSSNPKALAQVSCESQPGAPCSSSQPLLVIACLWATSAFCFMPKHQMHARAFCMHGVLECMAGKCTGRCGYEAASAAKHVMNMQPACIVPPGVFAALVTPN